MNLNKKPKILGFLNLNCEKEEHEIENLFHDRIKYFNAGQWRCLVKHYSSLVSLRLIEKYKDNYAMWHKISWGIKMPLWFITRHKDKVDWDHISKYQDLSVRFVKKYNDKLDAIELKRNRSLLEKFRKQMKIKIILNPEIQTLYS